MVDTSVVVTLSKLFKHKPSVRKGGEELMFFCPNCKHYKRKLNINITNGYYHCWVCNFSGKSFKSLLGKLNAPSEYYKELCNISTIKFNNKTSSTDHKKLFLPSEMIPLYKSSTDVGHKHALNYCFSRGLSIHEIIRYNIGYCSTGVFQNRIIVPSYDCDGNLNFYCGRDIYDSRMKYRLCDGSKDIIGFELFSNFNQPITLVEGVFDAFSVKYNVIPLFGKTLSKKLKLKLIDNRPPRVNVLLDNDAMEQSLEICEFLIQNRINAHLVLLDGKDPNEIGHINTWKNIDASDRIDESGLFKLKIKYKL